MKSQKLVIFSLLLLCIALIIQTVSSNTDTSANIETDEDGQDESTMFSEDGRQNANDGFVEPMGGGVHSRFLADSDDDSVVILANYTCDMYPTVCRYKKSDTKDCCGKKCVNVMTDRLNCFRCGRICNQGELCCKGKCVNIYSDRKHCGGCNIKCRKRIKCEYGVCGYAG